MPRYAYVNGRYVPHGDAHVHIEDRGFQFADGVYEVVTVVDGALVDDGPHMDRLARSMAELRIPWPMSRRAMEMVMRTLVRRNGVRNGIVYLQVTRGVAARDFRFPKGAHPSLVMTTKHMARFGSPDLMEKGVSAVTIPDIRWTRRDIKSVALLAQVLAKQAAAEAGAFEAWQVDPDGTVTEGASSNAWIVNRDGVLVTRPATNAILNGITRLRILKLAAEAGIPFEERAFTVEEAYGAREAFVSSATTFVTPVTRIDDRPVGNGVPGLLASRLREDYLAFAGGERRSA
jgi:D-alanine transaminase